MPDPSPRPVLGRLWGAAAPEGADTALGVAARVGAYCWVDQQLFALLGGWLAEVDDPAVRAALGEQADHAAWRALQWYALLPTAPPGADALVAAPPGVEAALAGVGELAGGPGRTVEKLAVVHRVLVPRYVAALRAHLDWSTPVAEPVVGRIGRLVLDDLLADWSDGERLLQAHEGGERADGGALAAVHAVQAALEPPLAAAGGLLGPHSVGRATRGGGA